MVRRLMQTSPHPLIRLLWRAGGSSGDVHDGHDYVIVTADKPASAPRG